MDFDEYQKWTRSTAIYPDLGKNLTYPTLGLAGEAGEVANKVKKIYRDKGGELDPDTRHAIANELGDVLWYLARVADELDIPLSVIAIQNKFLLQRRKSKGVIGGEGDDR